MIDDTDRAADVLDQASANEERERERALAAVRARAAAGPRPTGSCLWCDAGLADPRGLFCDSDCRDDWSRASNARQRNGGPMPR